jgi:hypothetical protein
MIVSANRPIMAVMAMLVSEKGLQQVLSLLTFPSCKRNMPGLAIVGLERLRGRPGAATARRHPSRMQESSSDFTEATSAVCNPLRPTGGRVTHARVDLAG